VPFGVVAGDRRGFLVESDDDADSLAQMFVGKADGVADKELLATSARWRCRFRLGCGARAIGDDGGIEYDPAAPGRMVLDDRLRRAQFDHVALAQRTEGIIDVADAHAQLQVLAYLQRALRIVEHFADGQIKSIQLGAMGLSKLVQRDFHEGDDGVVRPPTRPVAASQARWMGQAGCLSKVT